MVAPLRQAGDVALRSLQTPVDNAMGLLRTGRWRSSDVEHDIGWKVVNMVLADGRALRYRVTDNDDAHGPNGPGTEPIWAINIHGYFAGGSMYADHVDGLEINEFKALRVLDPAAHHEVELLHGILSVGEDETLPLTNAPAQFKCDERLYWALP